MKTLYLDCTMGAAGDMVTAALLELHPDREGFLRRFQALDLPGVELRAEPAIRCGILGTRVRVTVGGQEEHSHDMAPDEPPAQEGDHDQRQRRQEQEHSHSHCHHEGHDEGLDHGHGHCHCHGHGHRHGQGHNHDHDQRHHHGHSTLAQIGELLAGLDLAEPVRENALAVFGLIAEAESQVHGRPVEEIHFHEVGTLDAVADVTAAAMLFHELAPERILASPVSVGSGQVRCAHGILPVPAPATAWILRGLPICSGPVPGELCTPTGAALLKHFVSAFGPMPVMTVSQIGYGMGAKDLEAANCLRALLGQS